MHPLRRIVLTCLTLLCVCSMAWTDDLATHPPNLVPQPARLTLCDGTFSLAGAPRIVLESESAELGEIAAQLAGWLRERVGIEARVQHGAAGGPGAITLSLKGSADELGAEGYTLSVAPDGIRLTAANPRGLYWAAQSLRQLLPAARSTAPTSKPIELPALEIVDAPRFPWRGMLLDCGRHFMDKEFVKRCIDLLALHKLNVLHWHLTEDQGWRIQIRAYPKLTGIGAWRRATRDSEQSRDAQGRYGGFYTQDDVREIVAYAASRQITIVPEIELPGHSVAALAAYPELSCTGGPFEVSTEWGVHDDVYCAGNDATFAFLEAVLTEVIKLFPSPYIHIGGDEVPKTRWKACSKCQARMKAEGLKDEHELQSYFVRRIERFLNAHGRRLIGWDEILEGGLAPNATVQSWRGMKGAVAAATSGHDVIASPTSHCYLDYPQLADPRSPRWMGLITLEQCYGFDPLPAELNEEQQRRVLGVEGNVWTERIPQSRFDIMAYPRLCALAEVGWSPAAARDWNSFSTRMRTHLARLDALGVQYFVAPPRLVGATFEFVDGLDVRLEADFDEVVYTSDGKAPAADSPRLSGPLHLTESTTVRACTRLTNGRLSEPVTFKFRKLRMNKAASGESQAGVSCDCFEGRWQQLPDFSSLRPASRQLMQGLTVPPQARANDFALRFTGCFVAPQDGLYTFHLTADDAARLRIGETDPLSLEARWDAGPSSAKVLLQRGLHPLTLEYFQIGGERELKVEVEGPASARQPVSPEALRQRP